MRGWTLPEPRWEWEWTHAPVAEPPDRESPPRRAPAPVATVRTWAGSFTVGRYDLQKVSMGGSDSHVGFGADIAVSFKPGEFVDADRIEFVQVARSVLNDVPHNKYTADEKERQTAESRMVPGDGAHVDQFPRSPVPWFAPATPGYRRKDATGKWSATDASMTDDPDLTSGDIGTSAQAAHTGGWSQRFETAALATAGVQKGTYYGSVRWGWTWPEPGAAALLKFEIGSAGVPSPVFLAAAGLWNDSKTSTGARPEAVPIAESRKVKAKSAQLWDNPATRKTIATLPKGTPLQRIDIRPRSAMPSQAWFLAKVTVTGGRYAGRTGWLWLTDLS